MIKKIILCLLNISLLLVVLAPAPVRAQGEIVIRDTSVEADFPARLRFSLSAGSDAVITDIRLRYTVDRESFARVTSEAYLEFVPDSAVDVSWDWDMRRTGGLPAGSIVEYWWTIKDAGGNQMVTPPERVRFDDDRYDWQSLSEGDVTIYWYQGDQSFASDIMLTAQQALVRLTGDTGAYLKNPVRMYIYADAADLQGAMIFPQEWTGGVTFTRYGTIAIGISPENLDWGRRAIAHELTHLVVHQMTLNPYSGLPTWLEEGLAMYNEGELESNFAFLLQRAIDRDGLISVRSLASPFSTDADEARLSYAQSYSLVEFLVGTYGSDRMLELLNTFSRGSGYDDALEEVYGLDMDGLNELWQDYAGGKYSSKVEAGVY